VKHTGRRTHLADKPDLRGRFEREARMIASLNHPHICTLHDIGHQNGTDYLVTGYLEGETLAERLKKGPLPLADFNGVDFAGKAMYSSEGLQQVNKSRRFK
jgi:serine/threonine protein kinase